MLPNPNMAALVAGTHLANDLLQLMAPSGKKEARGDSPGTPASTEPVCLGDVGWLDHYGHRHLDVDVERL
jgi:hypothetical protein